MSIEKKFLQLSDVQIKASEDGTGMSFEGYASKFGHVDAYYDSILPGAYKSVVDSGALPKMFFNHNYYRLPVGKWVSMVEDDQGLYVKGEFTPGVSEAEDVYHAVKHGTVDGLSIGYSLSTDDYYYSNGVRYIKNVTKLYEISVVTNPADSSARITPDSVKSDMSGAANDADISKRLSLMTGIEIKNAEAIVEAIKIQVADIEKKKADEKALFESIKATIDKLSI